MSESGVCQACDLSIGEEKRIMREAVDRLDDEKKEIIRLRYWESLTIEEIASKLKISWGEVNNLIDESLEELRSQFLDLAKEVPWHRS